jgi:hypothetical protein
MTTILYPGMWRPRNPDVTAQVVRRFGSGGSPALPKVPWERQQLFLEPDLPEAPDLEDDGE